MSHLRPALGRKMQDGTVGALSVHVWHIGRCARTRRHRHTARDSGTAVAFFGFTPVPGHVGFGAIGAEGHFFSLPLQVTGQSSSWNMPQIIATAQKPRPEKYVPSWWVREVHNGLRLNSLIMSFLIQITAGVLLERIP